MDNRDWIIVVATIAGPVLAVQAQKWVESMRSRRARKRAVFEQLMATRAARVSAEHVQALNMIDIVFFGGYWLGKLSRTPSEQDVLDAWKEYHDHLGVKAADAGLQEWHTKGDDLFTALLFRMAQDTGFRFDRVQLKKGSYSPVAHGKLEEELAALRASAVRFFTGETSVKMDIVGVPTDLELAGPQREAIQKMNEAFRDGELRVRVVAGSADSTLPTAANDTGLSVRGLPHEDDQNAARNRA